MKKLNVIEPGRTENKLSLYELTNSEMKNVKGGVFNICICDANYSVNCDCVLAGFCICDVRRNCPGE